MNKYLKFFIVLGLLWISHILIVEYFLDDKLSSESWTLGYYLGMATCLLNVWVLEKEPSND